MTLTTSILRITCLYDICVTQSSMSIMDCDEYSRCNCVSKKLRRIPSKLYFSDTCDTHRPCSVSSMNSCLHSFNFPKSTNKKLQQITNYKLQQITNYNKLQITKITKYSLKFLRYMRHTQTQLCVKHELLFTFLQLPQIRPPPTPLITLLIVVGDSDEL